MIKKKVLLGYNYILHYRIPLFNLLSEKYDLTVLHSGKEAVTKDDLYKEIIVPSKKVGPFQIQKGLLYEVKKDDYDVILLLFDVRWIYTIISIYFYNKKAKLILWGAWLTDSAIANKIRYLLTQKADMNIFYTERSRIDFVNKGIGDDKTVVANNTFDVGPRIKSYESLIKKRLLFVGSLDSRKQNDVLINAFNNIFDKIPENIVLTIIGDGLESEKLINLVKQLGIESRVEFTGRIEDPSVLKNYYLESILSVSFGQAGLTVLQSLGYGVPFLTKTNAISGGEKTNIRDKENSLFCEDSIESLESLLIETCNDIKSAKEMGKKAYEYYSKFCTIENMCQGFVDAIENTNLSNVDKRL